MLLLCQSKEKVALVQYDNKVFYICVSSSLFEISSFCKGCWGALLIDYWNTKRESEMKLHKKRVESVECKNFVIEKSLIGLGQIFF